MLFAAGAVGAQTVEVHEQALFRLASEDPFASTREVGLARPPHDDTGFAPVNLPDFWHQRRPAARGRGQTTRTAIRWQALLR